MKCSGVTFICFALIVGPHSLKCDDRRENVGGLREIGNNTAALTGPSSGVVVSSLGSATNTVQVVAGQVKSTSQSGLWMEGGAVHSGTPNSTAVELPIIRESHHKKIVARKGAQQDVEPVSNVSSVVRAKLTTVQPVLVVSPSRSTTPSHKPTATKPLYTMYEGDRPSSKSFIESATTGKDFVLPIVLTMFALPAFIFLVKFLYNRGTEFTERQQYHRMYLIDGMYNTR